VQSRKLIKKHTDKDKRSSKGRTSTATAAAVVVKPLSIAALPALPPGQAYRTQEEECSVYDADSESQEQRRTYIAFTIRCFFTKAKVQCSDFVLIQC
jgi:hypothetical protein